MKDGYFSPVLVGEGQLASRRNPKRVEPSLFKEENFKEIITEEHRSHPSSFAKNYYAHSSPPSNLWEKASLFLLLLLLVSQGIIFNKEWLAQKPTIRTWMEYVCSTLSCTLPLFRDISGFFVLEHTLTPSDEVRGILNCHLVFANQSKRPQAFPKIKVIINALSGDSVVERVFEPSEYLSDWKEEYVLLIDVPVEVNLSFVKPAWKIGDFRVEFQ